MLIVLIYIGIIGDLLKEQQQNKSLYRNRLEAFMSLLSSVLGKIGYIRQSDGSHFYNIGKGSTHFLNGKDKLELALCHPVLFACIEIRAKMLSKVKFYTESSSGEKNFDDPLLDLFKNPNPFQSGEDFLKQFEWFKSTYGWVYQIPYGAVGFNNEAIFNLKASCIKFPDKMLNSLIWTKRDVSNYNKQKFEYEENDEKKSIELSRVIPFYDISNNLVSSKISAITSPSRLDSVIKQISNISLSSDAENVMIQSNGREMFSGGSAKGANLGASLPMDKEDKKDIDSKLINGYGLGNGRKRAIVTNQAVNYESLHIKLGELGLHESITANANLIREVFEVPNELYQAFKSGATFENQKEATINFIQDAIQPIADDLASSYSSHLKLDNPIKATFEHLPVMQHTEDKKADKILKIASAYEKLVRAEMSTEDINELFNSQGITISDGG